MSYKRLRTSYEDNQASAKHTPPFAFYGTPLPPLDGSARDDGTYVPVWKQEVRDEKGRKRLHGAFTGGFSAGYFNTVGSKEGWTPSTFVSSRSDRKKDGAPTQQRPEDFMDEEDIADMQESQKLQTQTGFSGLGNTEEDTLRRGLVSDLFRPTGDTMGVRLLQRMGWRPGQGLGPKLRRKARGDEEATDDAEEHLFAPDDVPMIRFDRKTDKFGIGWAGEQRLGTDATSMTAKQDDSEGDSDGDLFSARKPVRKPNKPKKTGFGVGVLNDTGSDDDEPYEIGPKISYNRVIGGDKKKRRNEAVSNASSGKAVPKAVLLSQKLLNKQTKTTSRPCHDGRLPLDGFILAAQALTLEDTDKYAPPPVPEGWQSPRVLNKTGTDQKAGFQSTADAAKASTLDPGQRASLLGEATLPGKSIFDFISPTARNRLAAASGASLPQGLGERAPAGYEPSAADQQRSMWDLVPRLDPTIAQAALTRGMEGWMPYGEDESKRERYRLFLQTMTRDRKELPPRAPSATNDEWATEMNEFAQAAQVFRPVSGAMASRFTSARAPPQAASDAPDVVAPPIHQPEKEDPAVQAARLGMFGPLTRSVADFFPTRLACKRFGVQPPAHVLHGPERADRTEVLGARAMEGMMAQAAAAAPTSTRPVEGAHTTAVKPAVVDIERNDALEGTKAGDDLFRAVFGSDSEDE